ncbi:MAG: SDR family oxidoreductase [Aeriscardovia sp.]|nr:SDR family oxidoreductase [Aeriscardovia sp.]
MKSKVVVVTGASSGIGEACAKLLAQQGHKIVMCARREERLKEIASSIREKGGEAVYLKADVTSIMQMEETAQAALKEFGRIDVWINNAGLMPVSEIIKDKVEEWDRMVDVNIKGVLYGIHACLKVMREQKEGHIINMGSVAGHVSNPASAVYSATKFAVRALSDALRKEEAQAKSGVRVP